MAQYAHPETLVETQWVAEQGNDPGIRLVEVDVDTTAYDQDHIPGAIAWNWTTQLCDTVERDIIPKDAFESLMAGSGVGNDTTVILYGDNNKLVRCLGLVADEDLRSQGRASDERRAEEVGCGGARADGRGARRFQGGLQSRGAGYVAARAFLPDVQRAFATKSHRLVDVRSPDEFTGKVLSPPGLPETCQRGGHIPGAKSIPWGLACKEDGSFKSADDLAALYRSKGITADTPTIAYCRIGERSSHTWFVLKYLLGYRDVTNYDGSWTEWGNMVRAPVERGPETTAV